MTLSTTARNAAVDAIAALLNTGTLVFSTSVDGEVATCTFGATAFAGASSGSAAANAITADTNATGGTITKCFLKSSGLATIITVTVGTSGTDLIMASPTVGGGDTVSVPSLSLTQPAS